MFWKLIARPLWLYQLWKYHKHQKTSSTQSSTEFQPRTYTAEVLEAYRKEAVRKQLEMQKQQHAAEKANAQAMAMARHRQEQREMELRHQQLPTNLDVEKRGAELRRVTGREL